MGIFKKIALAVVVVILISGLYVYSQYIGFGGPSLQAGIESDVWTDSLLTDIPVALDVTADGRIFVAMTGKFSQGAGDNRQQAFWLMDDRASNSIADRRAYIQKWIDKGELTESWFTDVHESVMLLTDEDGDGVGDKSTEFARITGVLDGVIAGVLAIGDDVFVTSIPSVYRFRDNDGDGVSDQRDVLSTGYGLRTAFVGHDLHGLIRGPDGKIYFSIGDRGFNIKTAEGKHLRPDMDYGRGGVFRMNVDGSDLELFHQGLRNPQELAFDNYGNLFTGDNNSDGGDKARIVYVVEGGDSGWSDGYQYQAEDSYLRGPWNAEKMWEPFHADQPAWMVPPVANHTDGPSGFAFYPGIGLPERYKEHFFLADYRFAATLSNILSFAIEPVGAGFKVVDVHQFASNALFVDQAFGYDGKMYAVTAPVFGGKKKIETFYDPEQQGSELVNEVMQLFAEGFAKLAEDRLSELLGHADQRVRMAAQFELAARESVANLNAVSLDPSQSEFARLHAIWGLGQIGPEALVGAGWQDFSAFTDELLAQALKIAGDSGAMQLRAAVRKHIGHSDARVSYFAAMSAGKLKDSAAVTPLLELAARVAGNADVDADAFLRHAVVWALVQIGDRQAIKTAAAEANANVRLTALLTLRQWSDPAIADFLSDTDPRIVVEAARAIYDLPITEALPQLAALALQQTAVNDDGAQQSYALHRRIIHAAVRVGGEAGAEHLLHYAADSSKPKAMRLHALDALQTYTAPPPLDAVVGMYRPIAARDASLVYPAIDELMPAIVKSDIGERALAVAVHYGRVPLDDQQLIAMLADKNTSSANKLSAMNALSSRSTALASGALAKAVTLTLDDADSALAVAGLRALVLVDKEKAAAKAIELADAAPQLELRQAAITLLGELGGSVSQQWLASALDRLIARKQHPGTGLEILAAAEKLGGEPLSTQLQNYRQSIPAGDVVAVRHTSLVGGNVQRGRSKFATGGDCLRCHSVAGEGGNAGPDLAGVGAKYSAKYLLEAMVTPGSAIAPGFGNVSLKLKDGSRVAGIMVGEDAASISIRAHSSHGEGGATVIAKSDIAEQNGPISGMPPMGLVLSHSDLRDVMAYMQSLR